MSRLRGSGKKGWNQQKQTGIFTGLRPFVFGRTSFRVKTSFHIKMWSLRDYCTLPVGKHMKPLLCGKLSASKQILMYRLGSEKKRTIFITSVFCLPSAQCQCRLQPKQDTSHFQHSTKFLNVLLKFFSSSGREKKLCMCSFSPHPCRCLILLQQPQWLNA